MSGIVAWGLAQGVNDRETALQATQQALNQLGAVQPVLAIALLAQELNVAEAVTGISSLLGNTPLWGLGTVRPLSMEADRPRSVGVLLFSGNELKARVEWLPGFAQDGLATGRQLRRLVFDGAAPQGVLLTADGINGDGFQVCGHIGEGAFPVGGCLAAGEYQLGKTYQLAGTHSGSGALSAALLDGRFRMGVGFGHGWRDVGVEFQVTRSRGSWVQMLDGVPAAEIYSRLFGYPAREWAFPPLTDLVRLYPLGIEISPVSDERLVRSPLHVEVDGSLRMNVPVAEEKTAYLMVGDPKACLDAAVQAARQARRALGEAHPLAALVFIDLAWQMLFESQPTQVLAAVQTELGTTPVVGAYTLGQIARPHDKDAPAVLNQHIEVVLIGEAE